MYISKKYGAQTVAANRETTELAERFSTAPPKYTSLGPLQHHQLFKQARHAFNEGDSSGSTVPNTLQKESS